MQHATKRSADLHRSPMEPTKCRMHFVGEEERGMTELSASAGSEGYAAYNDEAQRRSPSTSGNPRSAECTSWERRSSEMTELSASAGSEGYAACDDEAQRRSPSAAGNPRSAECTSWERRSSGMTEFSALAGSEEYAACDDDGDFIVQKGRRVFLDSLREPLRSPERLCAFILPRNGSPGRGRSGCIWALRGRPLSSRAGG